MKRTQPLPLPADELQAIDEHLRSEHVPAGTLTLHQLRGFLYAVAASPTALTPTDWLPAVWGSEEDMQEDSGEAGEPPAPSGMARIPDVLRLGDPDVAPYLAGRLYFQMRGIPTTSSLTTFNDDLRTYTEKGGETDIFSASAYDAAMALSLGMQYAAAKSLPLDKAILAVTTGAGTNQTVVTADGVDAAVIAKLKAGEDVNYEGASSSLEFSQAHPAAPNGHDHFGYMTKGLYYVEQIEKVDANTYQYRALVSPVAER